GDRTAHRSLHVGGLRLGRHSARPYQDVEESAQAGQHGCAGQRQGSGPAHHRGRDRGGQQLASRHRPVFPHGPAGAILPADLPIRDHTMSAAAKPAPTRETLLINDLLPTCSAALKAAEQLLGSATASVAQLVRGADGQIDSARLEQEQFAAHGLAWLATYVATLKETLHWAERLQQDGRLRELEMLILQAGFGEYLAQMAGGIAMSQVEVCRLADLGITDDAQRAFRNAAPVDSLIRGGNTSDVRSRIAALI